MERNMSLMDRVFRLVLAGVLALGGLALGSIWGLLGLVLVPGALAGWSPLYQYLGWTSCRITLRRTDCEGT